MMFVFSTIQISVRSTGCGCMWTLPGAVVFSCPPDTAPPASGASRGMYQYKPVIFVCRGIERYVSTQASRLCLQGHRKVCINTSQSSLSAGASRGMYQHMASRLCLQGHRKVCINTWPVVFVCGPASGIGRNFGNSVIPLFG